MPDTTEEVTEAVSALREQGFTAVKLGWGPLGRIRTTTSASPPPPARPAATASRS